MKPITNEIKEKIKLYRKNNMDISELIKDIDIKGQNLSYCLIKDLNRTKENMSGTIFDFATIGEDGKVTNLSNNNFSGASFCGTKFLGKIYLRRCNCQNSNFNGSWMFNVEYQYTDFRYATFCESIIRMGSDFGRGAKMDSNFFKELASDWNLEIRVKDE
jgi:uncharacterized protein YjbI with pentapeptide repeats